MSAIQELFRNSDNWILAVFVIIVSLLSIKELINLGSFFAEKFGLKTKKTTEKEKLNARVCKLEKHDSFQYEKLNQVSDTLQEIKETIKNNEEERKQDIVASYRTDLFRMHREFMKKKYVTEEGLRTFIECGKRYEKAGGNDIYHDKLYPEVLNLPVRPNEEEE